MKLGHLESFRPICPSCRKGNVEISKVIEGSPTELDEGLLECSACRHLYPVIDGIPVLVKDLRRVVSDQILSVMARCDLSETTLALLGECCGPSSTFDLTRQHLSSYVSGHWEETALPAILDAGLEVLGATEGPFLDVGCSVGRGTHELSRRGLVLGVDLSFAMLRVARRITRAGKAVYPRRESGLVYEERTVEVELPAPERVDFWCADALALPFRPETFGLVSSLNLLDCVQGPLEHLVSLRDVLRDKGGAIVATPFDWSPQATPLEQWLGGHSPHAFVRGRPEDALRALLGSEQLPGLRLAGEKRGLPWPVRLHARAEMRYLVDVFALVRDWRSAPDSK